MPAGYGFAPGHLCPFDAAGLKGGPPEGKRYIPDYGSPKNTKEWEQVAALEYLSGLLLGTLTMKGRSGAAYGTRSKEGRRRLGYIAGMLPSSPRGPRHVL